MKQMENRNYYITDHLGSTRMVVDDNNHMKETINYYPYGGEMTMTSPSQLLNNTNVQQFRFSGKELDRYLDEFMYDAYQLRSTLVMQSEYYMKCSKEYKDAQEEQLRRYQEKASREANRDWLTKLFIWLSTQAGE